MYIYKVKLLYHDRLNESYNSSEDVFVQWKAVEKKVIHGINPTRTEAFSLAYKMAIESTFGKNATWEDWRWVAESITFITNA